MPAVAVLRTSPGTVVEDYSRLLDLAGCAEALTGERGVFVKPAHSHDAYYPAVSTPPWQLDGVLTWLRKRGVPAGRIAVGENRTVCTQLPRVLRSHGWGAVLARHGVEFHPLDQARWEPIEVDPAALSMDWGPVGGPALPEPARGRTLVHLVPLKVHGHSVVTGSMKAAFNLLLRHHACHRAHATIHAALVDMLYLQQRVLEAPLVGVIDATWAGDGRGPVTLRPHRKDLILAGTDLVALDAVAATLMGFDPREVPFIWTAHQRGLGCADLSQIEVVGEDLRGLSFGFESRRNLVLFTDQLLRRRLGGLTRRAVFGTRLEAATILASRAYHNVYWSHLRAPRRMRAFWHSDWAPLVHRS